MGLEIVELFMDIEDEFGVHMDDELNASIRTVGELHAAVIILWSKKGHTIDDAFMHSSWVTIQRITSTTFGVFPEDIEPDTRFLEDLGAG